jgi:hypothetical protein
MIDFKIKVMIKNSLIIFLLFFSFSTFSQDKKNEVGLIKTTIENYYNGYMNRDFLLLEKAFDPQNGTMKVPILKDEKIIGFQNHFFKDLIQKWSSREKLSDDVLKKCALTILNIDIVEQKMASAKINMKVDTITYIDILSLQKIAGDWKITNKIFVIEE